MPNWIVNKNQQANGDHEVHDLASNYNCLPNWSNQVSLGYHATCSDTVSMARRYYTRVNGCRWCAPACHTS